MDRFVVRLGDDQSSSSKATCSKRLCLDNVGYSTPLSLFSSLFLSLSPLPLSLPPPIFPSLLGGKLPPAPPPLDETLNTGSINLTTGK